MMPPTFKSKNYMMHFLKHFLHNIKSRLLNVFKPNYRQNTEKLKSQQAKLNNFMRSLLSIVRFIKKDLSK